MRSVRWVRVLPALLWLAAIRVLSSLPDPPGGRLTDVPHLDKLAHAGLFGVLALSHLLYQQRFSSSVPPELREGGDDGR